MLKLIVLLNLLMIQTSFAGRIDGGISGGGGEVLPSDPAGRYTIESTLREARAVAYYYFASQKAKSNLKELAPIFDIIKNTEISIESNGPCFDSENYPMDGSVYSTTPNTICISSFTLGKKLSEDNAWVQTMALVIHEYSHLIGYDEEQADKLQAQAILALNSKAFAPLRNLGSALDTFIDEWYAYSKNLTYVGTEDANDMTALTKLLNAGNMIGIDSEYEAAMLKSDKFYAFSIFGIEEHNLVRTLLTKYKMIQLGVTSRFAFTPGPEFDNKVKYDNAFNGQKEVELKDFMESYDSEGRFNKSNAGRFDYVSGIKITNISPTIRGDYTELKKDTRDSLLSLREELKVVSKKVIETHYQLLGIK